MVIVLGVTSDGDKIPIGFIQTHTENHESISALFSQLIDRGLNYKHGLLFIIDGAKGLLKAIEKVFGEYAVIQRCQWHKRENIVSYLNDMEQSLTLHRLGLHDQFSTSFSTINCIENLNSQLSKYIGKVKYWKNSSQRYRWVAFALLEIEQRMRKVNNYKNLKIMQQKINQVIKMKT